MTDDDLRDGFGDELTDALRTRSQPIPSATAAVTVVNRVRRMRARRRIFTATLAAAVAASAVLVFSLRTHGTAHVNVAAGPSSTSTGPAAAVGPTGVVDWTWVSPDRGWALLRTPCGTTVCVALARDDRRRPDLDDRTDPPSAVSVRADRRRDLLFGPALCLRRSVRFRSRRVVVRPGPAPDDRRRQHMGPRARPRRHRHRDVGRRRPAAVDDQLARLRRQLRAIESSASNSSPPRGNRSARRYPAARH